MKDFKLRGWHEKYKVMLYPPGDFDSMTNCRTSKEEHFYHPETKQVFSAHVSWDGRYYLNGEYQEIDWMFSTGKVDSEGKEIYDGDIILSTDLCDETNIGKFLVHYCEKDLMFYNRVEGLDYKSSWQKFYSGFHLRDDFNYKVIGNKYENLDLIILGSF